MVRMIGTIGLTPLLRLAVEANEVRAFHREILDEIS
jgi:hypothetical protein